jgi:mono/diheme cytochrome c family protein
VLAFGRAVKVVLGIVVVIGLQNSLSAHAEDFDAGKSAPQLFASNCSTCHQTPRGLAKRMSSWSLDSFLREHYTASRASADTLSAYLMAQGGGGGSSHGKRSALVSPASNHRKRSTLLPPADIPNH